MSRISRSAAEKIKSTAQWVDAQRSVPAGFAPTPYPIRLAKTTALHSANTTQDVTLLWGPKGTEVDGTDDQDTVQAFNRYEDIDADAIVRIARVGPEEEWEILNRSTGTAGAACGPCNEGSGELTVDLGDGFMAAEAYLATLFCENIAAILYSEFAAGEWTGTADVMTVDCNGDSVTWTSRLIYTDHNPGGLVIEWSDGTDTWKWRNTAAWQPGLRTEMELFEGPAECPCAPFLDFTCLIPVEAPEE